MEIKISTKGIDDIVRKVSEIPSSVMAEIGQTIKSDLLLNFRSEQSPDGSSWADLKPSTIKSKLKKSGKVVKLQDTGNLKKSLNYTASSGEVKIGYGIGYSVFHQLGTKNMVARKILPTEISELDMEEIERIFLKGIDA